MSRLHTCIRLATVRTVNTVQQNQFSVSFHSCNENIPLTIPSSILPKTPTFRVFLLPYPSPRPGAILEFYSVIEIIIHWTFLIFQVICTNTNENTCAYMYFNVLVIRDSLWFQVTVFLECCAASVCERCTKFRLMMWLLRVLETSYVNHPVKLSHIHEVQRPQLHHCDRPKTRYDLLIPLHNFYSHTVSSFQIRGTNGVGPVDFVLAEFLDFIFLQFVLRQGSR